MKATKHRRWLCVLFLASATCGIHAAAQPMAFGSIGKRMAGNTLSLPGPDGAAGTTSAYLAEDGSGWIVQAGRDQAPAPIHWFTYSDGTFCVTRTTRGAPQPGECATYTFAGDRVRLTLDTGDTRDGTVLPGDPNGLEARARGQAPRRLQGADAVHALVGNTLAIVAIGSRHQYSAYHLLADGSGRWLQDEESFGDDVGKVKTQDFRWRIDPQGRWCTAWTRGEDCMTIAITGDRVLLRQDDQVLAGLLETGDTRHLAPQAMAQSQRMLRALTDATLVREAPTGQADGRAYYLGADGRGEELQRTDGNWTTTERVQWLFRPDRRWLCISPLPPEHAHPFRTSHCASIVLSGNKITLTPENGTAAHGTLSKGRPSAKRP
jgi:hypothetical protein